MPACNANAISASVESVDPDLPTSSSLRKRRIHRGASSRRWHPRRSYGIIHQEQGGAARNAGLDVARGRYLAFFDADDFAELRLLEKAVRRAETGDVVAYRVDSYNDETGETLPMPWSLDADAFPADRVSSPGDNPDKLFYAFQNWTWNKLFRSSFVQASGLRFHEVQRSADLYFVCCALAQADRVATVDEVLYHYRVNNPNSNIATNDGPLDFHRSFVVAKQHLENARPPRSSGASELGRPVFFSLCA
ncbi:MAG: glycosyltransferase [Eggerthella lenta]